MIRVLKRAKGNLAEDKALNYLCQQGLKLIQRNYLCKMGEVDLIMRDKSYWVFIEVRSRVNLSFGSGIESITPAKRKKIMRTATHYLMMNQLMGKVPSRFDVVSIDGPNQALTWIKDAFGEDY